MGDPYSEEISDSESEGTLDSDDDRESCVSPAEEDEYFYDAVSLDDSQNASYISFPTRSLSSVTETNLSGLVMGYSQPSKSDQVPDLNEKANLTQKSQVPELNETHLVEGKRKLQNVGDCHGDNHFCLLSNMMEKKSHVVDNISDYKGICQVLFDEIDEMEDQSDVSRRAERAISGLSQSNQRRLGKSEGEPGIPFSATNSDRQSQKVGLENLSLNSPTEVEGDIFHDIYCC